MSAVLGIDIRGEMICTASVGEANGRNVILRLAQAPVTERMQFPDKVTLAIAVPDDSVMVKNYLMPNVAGSNIDLRLQFEMAQSLLDESDQFQFAVVKTGLPDRYLGLISRKTSIKSLGDKLAIPAESSTLPLARGAALGKGFRKFGKMPGGELLGVMDITPTKLSLCLLYRGEVTALGHLKLDEYSLTDELSLKRLAMEVKTLVSFKLATLAEMGLSLPMSSLTVTGEISDLLLEQLSRYFPSGLARGEVDRSKLGPGLDDSVRPELFFPALGLTVI